MRRGVRRRDVGVGRVSRAVGRARGENVADVQVDGELQQITPEMQEKMRIQEAARQRSAQAAAKSVEDMVQQLGYAPKRAEAIVRAREEKAALRTSLIFDMQAWAKKTGQTPWDTFGIYLSDLKAYKPKALKELRDRFDRHVAQHQTGIVDRPGDDQGFGDFMRAAVARPDSNQQGQDPAF